ncbi:MAG: EAL domain-containing protein [Vicinamibacteria bacterium]|nr:EAL domain-containing protein [Vicinamibacteria bacterium]
MRAFRDFSIRSKLTLIAMLTNGAVLLLSVTAFVGYELIAFRAAMKQNIETLADVVGSNSTAALTFNDQAAAEATLGALRVAKHVIAAAIFTKDGRLFATYLRSDLTAMPELDRHAGGHVFERESLSVCRSIMLDGERIGAVSVRSDLTAMGSRLMRYAWVVLAVLAASSLLTLLISARLQSLISRPISHLAETARRFSIDKDFAARAQKRGQDEIGVLIDGFNEMLEQIAESNVVLQLTHDDLERRVQERTLELRQEITARKRVEGTIRRLAYHDALTGLPNRLLFGDRLSQALARAERSRIMLAVLFLDLDRFKMINDLLGHAVGDKALCEIGRRLLQSLRIEDTVARLGGDEFLVLLPAVDAMRDATLVAEKILRAFQPAVVIEGHPLNITVSIGISVFPLHGRDGETLIKNADLALYHAKERGRNNWQLFVTNNEETALDRLSLANDLRQAIDRGQLRLHFQPQIDARTNEIVSVEALLRWAHPERGLLDPRAFIGLAEEIGVIMPIGEWVLRAACRQGRVWRESGLSALRLAVNVSVRHFRKASFEETLERIADEEKFDLGSLEVEITESVFMENIAEAARTMQALKKRQVSLVIDGFGTGYSSLSHLRRLPVDALKIAQSFVSATPEDADNVAIVTLIIAMAHNLGLKVVAVGVEKETQRDFLLSSHCDLMQGHLFGPPMSIEDVTRLLQRQLDDSRT